MKRAILAAVIAVSVLGAVAPAAMAQPYGWRHHYWHHRYYGRGFGWRHPYWGHRRFCYNHPYRC